MTYPVRVSQTIAPNGTVATAFRPLQVGLVTVIAVGTTQASPTTDAALELRLDVFKPGETAAVFSQTGQKLPGAGPVILSGDISANASDLGGDWTALVTNTGQAEGVCSLTARFQVLAGNLGLVDHIIVLMMENRSFDHMLGYLSLESNRADVDGLTGTEFNNDSTGNRVTVHHLESTEFPLDPGHGWVEIDEQLSSDAPDHPNAGFVTNFARVLEAPRTVHHQVQIAAGQSQDIALQPGAPGAISVRSFAVNLPGILHSSEGLLGKLALLRPGESTPVASTTTPLGGALLTLRFTATEADLAISGNWLCRISNATDAALTFDMDIRFIPRAFTNVTDTFQIDQEDTRVISFRPGGVGPITIRSQTVHPPVLHSETGLLGKLTLRRPGNPTPVATSSAPLGGHLLALTHTATVGELATPGDWTCEVFNGTLQQVTFETEIDFIRAPLPAGAIMGFYNASQVGEYAFLAEHFAVCNKWFASLPTDTWPNRLYSLTGGSGGLVTTPEESGVTIDPPGFLLKTIFEVLQEHGIDWMVFFGNVPFPLIFKRLAQDAVYTARMRSLSEFFDRARTGDLPAVSWIEPTYSDVTFEPNPNDDHPPGDITPGQKLVQELYDAVSGSPAWSKTLLLIVYDEHGGFYDHRTPPGTPSSPGGPPSPGGPADDNPAFRRYGVRVPAFVVSPWAPKSVSNETYDHTSLLATILRRFCAGADGSMPRMGARADSAKDVGALLSATAPRAAPAGPTMHPAAGATPVAPRPNTFGNVLRKALFGF
jgi:phospholipase C